MRGNYDLASDNSQHGDDQLVVIEFNDMGRLLVVIADGVTDCGAGRVASVCVCHFAREYAEINGAEFRKVLDDHTLLKKVFSYAHTQTSLFLTDLTTEKWNTLEEWFKKYIDLKQGNDRPDRLKEIKKNLEDKKDRDFQTTLAMLLVNFKQKKMSTAIAGDSVCFLTGDRSFAHFEIGPGKLKSWIDQLGLHGDPDFATRDLAPFHRIAFGSDGSKMRGGSRTMEPFINMLQKSSTPALDWLAHLRNIPNGLDDDFSLVVVNLTMPGAYEEQANNGEIVGSPQSRDDLSKQAAQPQGGQILRCMSRWPLSNWSRKEYFVVGLFGCLFVFLLGWGIGWVAMKAFLKAF